MGFRPTICLDFDGVLHAYSRGWNGGVIYDEPTPGCREAMEELHANGRLVILTARERDTHDAVWEWLRLHKLDQLVDLVTSHKPPAAVYVDDRAVHFDGDWSDAIDTIRERMAEKPWRDLTTEA